jgi:hypothetical protein
MTAGTVIRWMPPHRAAARYRKVLRHDAENARVA